MDCKCGKSLSWGCDYTYEDYGLDDIDGIVSNYSCSNEDCNVSEVLIYENLK